MEVRKGYKQTEVGVIPDDWDLSVLVSMTDQTRTIRYGIVQPGSYTANGTLMLRSQDYSKGWTDTTTMHRVTIELETQYQNARLKAGDIVMTVVGANTGQVVEVPDWLDKGILSRSTARIAIDRGKANPRFIKFFLQSRPAKRQLLDYLKEGAQPVLSCTDLAKFRIPIPSALAEQEAIAEALSDADALIEAVEQLLTKKRQVKQGAMSELLTGKRRLSGFSGEWETKKLGEITEIISGGTPSTRIDEYWNGNINWCTPTDITGTSGKYLDSTEKQITELGLKNSSANLLPKGTLLLCTRATIGEVKIATDVICTNQGFKSLICSNQVNNEFLYYVLLTLKPKLIEKAIGSTFLEITKKQTALIEIRMPSIAEQTAIAEILSDMDTEISALEEKLVKARQVKAGMMSELLTGKIRLVATTTTP